MSGWGTGWEPEGLIILNEVEINKCEPIDVTLIPKFLNKKPTHDPYTNPNAHIYYECGCGAILDPGTKSFAQLNNCASQSGWKVRWGTDSYVPYCVKCGEEVE